MSPETALMVEVCERLGIPLETRIADLPVLIEAQLAAWGMEYGTGDA